MDSREQYTRRISEVERIMAARGMDALLLNRTASVRYLTGASNACSWVLLTRTGKQVALILESDLQDYVRQTIVADVRAYRPHDPLALFRKLPKELGLARGSIALEKDHLKVNQFDMLAECLGDALNRGESADEILEEARTIKAPEEIAKIEEASQLAVAGIQMAREWAKPGVREIDLARSVRNALLDRGVDESTFLYVASGSRSSLAHARPSRAEIGAGVLVVDITAYKDGFLSDVARTFFLGDRDPEPLEAYDYYKDLLLATIDQMSDDVPLVDVRSFFYKNLTLRDGWIPLTGPLVHGAGLSAHDLPRFDHHNLPHPERLAANMVVSCSNIGMYSHNGWGIRYEDTVVVTDGKPVNLTKDA